MVPSPHPRKRLKMRHIFVGDAALASLFVVDGRPIPWPLRQNRTETFSTTEYIAWQSHNQNPTFTTETGRKKQGKQSQKAKTKSKTENQPRTRRIAKNLPGPNENR